MYQWRLLTPKQRIVLEFIVEWPNSTQQQIINFCGGGNSTQKIIYFLQSVRFIKVKKDKQKNRYSLDKRRKL